MKIHIFLAIVTIGLVQCAINLSAIPNVQDNFDIHKYLGVWYDQGKVAPCTWSGSRQFKDWKLNFMYEGSNLYLVQNWRKGSVCVNTKSVLMERTPGCYLIQDPIGDVYTGEEKIVATDYKRFSITYGCLKRTIEGDKCATPWLSVETRQRHPDAQTMYLIDKLLRKTFGFGFDLTERVIHDNRKYCPIKTYG